MGKCKSYQCKLETDELRAQLAEARASERERCADIAASKRKSLDADAIHYHETGLPDERDRAYNEARVAQRIEGTIRALSHTNESNPNG